MLSRLQPLRRNVLLRLHIILKPHDSIQRRISLFPCSLSEKFTPFNLFFQNFSHVSRQISGSSGSDHEDNVESPDTSSRTDSDALRIQNLLKLKTGKALDEIKQSLQEGSLCLSEELVLNVLKRHGSDWKTAYTFFGWVSGGKISNGFLPGTGVYNQMLDILGRMHRFDELSQVLEEMSQRKSLINERTYAIVSQRYAAAHRIEDAIQFFYKRKEFGLELDLIAFQTLLLSLCRYKHVEAAEFLFHNKMNEFVYDIKTWNIILNGWCVLGNLREAKRFWNDIVTSEYKPDMFTYGIFINSLSKAGKISTAVKLFQAMWEKGCLPDVTICNCIIDGLCFKKRIPEALEIFGEMNGRECPPDVATYNSLIKHLCRIRRMDTVYELLDEMEMKGDNCSPNTRTYGYLLNSSKKPEEVYNILKRMEKNGCKIVADNYNLLLRLSMKWNNHDQVEAIWHDMEKSGQGPDQRSYTVMVHGLFDRGMFKEALNYYQEMTSKGMVPEPRTKLLVNAMNIRENNKDASMVSNKRARKGRKTFLNTSKTTFQSKLSTIFVR